MLVTINNKDCSGKIWKTLSFFHSVAKREYNLSLSWPAVLLLRERSWPRMSNRLYKFNMCKILGVLSILNKLLPVFSAPPNGYTILQLLLQIPWNHLWFISLSHTQLLSLLANPIISLLKRFLNLTVPHHPYYCSKIRKFLHMSCYFFKIFTPEAGWVPHLSSFCLRIIMKWHNPYFKILSHGCFLKGFFVHQTSHNQGKIWAMQTLRIAKAGYRT